MLIECRLAFFQLCDPSFGIERRIGFTRVSSTFTSPESGLSSLPAPGTSDEGSRPSTSTAQSPFDAAKLTISPELDLTVEIEDRRNPEKPTKFRITGGADWALAYGYRKPLYPWISDHRPEDFCRGNTLIAVAKTPMTLAGAQSQLLTYLAILQRTRRQHDKINHCVQGFFSDGENYGFMAINNEGMVVKSRYYNITDGNDLRTVFNWIVSLMVTSVKSSPSTSPTRPGSTRDEIMEKVFVEFYRKDLYEEDEDMFVDVSAGKEVADPGDFVRIVIS